MLAQNVRRRRHRRAPQFTRSDNLVQLGEPQPQGPCQFGVLHLPNAQPDAVGIYSAASPGISVAIPEPIVAASSVAWSQRS